MIDPEYLPSIELGACALVLFLLVCVLCGPFERPFGGNDA